MGAEDSRSVCLLVKGLQPSFEITPLSANKKAKRFQNLSRPNQINRGQGRRRQSFWSSHETSSLGMRPIWQITRQPYVVPNLRKTLEKQSWGVFSGDIPFLNRLFSTV